MFGFCDISIADSVFYIMICSEGFFQNREADDIGKKIIHWRHIARIVKSGSLRTRAAALAYSFVMSFVPAVIIIISMASRIDIPRSEMYGLLRLILPRDAYESIAPAVMDILQMKLPARTGYLPFLYFISSAVRNMMIFSRELYRIPDMNRVKLYFLSYVYAVVFIIFVLICLGAALAADAVIKNLSADSGGAAGWVRYVVMFLILWFFLCVVYIVFPGTGQKFSDVGKGALVCAGVWIAVSGVFGFYADNFSSYGILFGSLGGILVFLVWLYISSYILLLGVYINSAPWEENEKLE